jgi:hypothetical protein
MEDLQKNSKSSKRLKTIKNNKVGIQKMDMPREIDLMFFVAMINVEVFVAIITNYRLKHTKNKDQGIKSNIKSWVWFLYFLALANTFGVISRFYLSDFESLKNFFNSLSIASNFLAVTFKVNNIEKVLKPFKHLYFTYIDIFIIILTISTWSVLRDNISIALFIIIVGIIGFLILPYMYLKVAIKSTGVMRKYALYVVIGVIVLEFALTLQAHNIELIFPGYTLTFFERFGFPPQIINPCFVIACVGLIYESYTNSL